MPTTFNVSLSWTIPSTRENGSPLVLSELSGYEVYYSVENQSKSAVIPVAGATQASLVVRDLPAGTYYFAISAIDSKGVKSALSPMVSTKIGQ